MKFRFIVTALPATLFVLGALLICATCRAAGWSLPPAAPPDSTPWRAVWVVRDFLAREETARGVVQRAGEIGATDLMVQVRGRGDAYYRSALEPASALLRAGDRDTLAFDPLAAVLDEARRSGLRVHAWFNVFLVRSGRGPAERGHVLREHPGWAVSPAPRGAEGTFLDPRVPGVVDWTLAVAEDLVRAYPVDGIHWDYVRYPLRDGGEPDAEAEREAVSSFVAAASARLRAARPGLVISAAVFPDPTEAAKNVRQEWVRWIREGWIDRALVMAYTGSLPRLDDWRRRAELAGAPAERLVTGLGVYKTDAQGLAAELEWAREHGPGGVSIFSMREILDDPAISACVARAFESYLTAR